MTLPLNHPPLGTITTKVQGKWTAPLLRLAILLVFCLPIAAFGQSAVVNPLSSDTTKPAQGGTNILSLQFKKAKELELKKDYKKAIEAYTGCINNAPPNSDVLKVSLKQRANCYFKLKEYDLCVHDANQVPAINIQSLFLMTTGDAIKITPQVNHDALILSGLSKMLLGAGAAGCVDFKTAYNIETHPSYTGEKIADTYIKRYCR